MFDSFSCIIDCVFPGTFGAKMVTCYEQEIILFCGFNKKRFF